MLFRMPGSPGKCCICIVRIVVVIITATTNNFEYFARISTASNSLLTENRANAEISKTNFVLDTLYSVCYIMFNLSISIGILWLKMSAEFVRACVAVAVIKVKKKRWITICIIFFSVKLFHWRHANIYLGLDGRDGIPGEPGLDGVPGVCCINILYLLTFNWIPYRKMSKPKKEKGWKKWCHHVRYCWNNLFGLNFKKSRRFASGWLKIK